MCNALHRYYRYYPYYTYYEYYTDVRATSREQRPGEERLLLFLSPSPPPSSFDSAGPLDSSTSLAHVSALLSLHLLSFLFLHHLLPALNACNSFARLHTAHPLSLSSLAHPLFLHSLLLSVPRLLSSLYLFSFFLSFYPAAPRAGGLTSATFSPLPSCYVPLFSTFWFASCTSTPSFDLLHVLCSLIRLGLFHARSSELLRSCFSLSSINLAAPLSMGFSLFLWRNLRCPGPEIILPPGWNLLPSV